jgi:hypothetical protein
MPIRGVVRCTLFECLFCLQLIHDALTKAYHSEVLMLIMFGLDVFGLLLEVGWKCWLVRNVSEIHDEYEEVLWE